MARAYIGTSGWNYKHWWNGEFYPQALKPADWLKFFVRHFNTVEINNSFYRLPSPEMFESWRSQVPADFRFAVKASRFLTHIKRLKESEEPLDLFFRNAEGLKRRMGPVLFQLPPQFKLDLARLEGFLRALRRPASRRRVRCSIEVRDRSWLTDDVFDLLREHDVALCFADWRNVHVTEPLTAAFVHVRRHYGPLDGNYGKADLDRDAERIQEWLSRGLDVYIYYNNDMHGHAIRNAQYLQQRVGSSNA